MTLLLDQNLSYRLVRLLRGDFPGINHIGRVKLRDRTDQTIWRHAETIGAVVVSKDWDFLHLATALGPPPKLVFLAVGNAGTARIARLLKRHRDDIRKLVADPSAKSLILSLPDD